MSSSNLYRLVYTSFKNPICDEGEIQKILKIARKENPKHGITGVLIHSNSRFLQYLEGEKEQLERLFDEIQRDKRHTAVVERNFEPITERAFPKWLMAFKDADVESIAFNSKVSDKDIKFFEEIISGEVSFDDTGMRLLKLFFQTRS